jgi:ribose-phosphate pyrophosphokinase
LPTPAPAMKGSCFLFYCPQQRELAQRIAAARPDNVTLGEIQWRTFADGFPNLFIEGAAEIRNCHVVFLASFRDPREIFEQLAVIFALPRMFIASFTLVLPFFPTGTAERIDSEGEVPTAVTLARILSHVPLTRGGPAGLMVFDIHALQERFYFGDGVLPIFQSGIPLLKRELASLPDAADVTIAYPDEGAWKRFHGFFRDFPEVICTKVRDGDQRIVKLKEGEPKGKHVVIVDDLVQSGGTLIECQKVLAAQGAAHVSAYVTHGVFPRESYRRFLPEGPGGAQDGFKYFWLTDSCPHTAEAVQELPPFKVLTLADVIAECLDL